MIKMIRFKAKIIRDGKGYMAEFPDLPGCFSYGRTIEDAKLKSAEALDLYLEEANNPQWILPAAKDYQGTSYHWISAGPDIAIPLMIREARKTHNLSQQRLADLLQMKLQTYQKLEYPRKSNPTAKTLILIASVLEESFELSA